MKATLEVTGPIPSKKNMYQRKGNYTGVGHAMYIPQDVRDRLNEIQRQIIEQWHRRPAKVEGYEGRCRNVVETEGKRKVTKFAPKICGSQVLFKSGKCPRCFPAVKPLQHPHMVFRLAGMTTAQDRDNQVQTLLDCMVAGGILLNDNIKHSNGWLAIAPATKGDKGCVINLQWEARSEVQENLIAA